MAQAPCPKLGILSWRRKAEIKRDVVIIEMVRFILNLHRSHDMFLHKLDEFRKDGVALFFDEILSKAIAPSFGVFGEAFT